MRSIPRSAQADAKHQALSRSLAGAFVASVLAFTTVPLGCASSTDGSPALRCTPGAYVFCRCQDRAEGTKLCHADGQGFESCACGFPSELTTDKSPLEPQPGDAPSTTGDIHDASVTCGDKVVQANEDCDDGNADDSDGCDRKCRLSGVDPSATQSCPGLDVHVWGSRAATLVSTTIGSKNTSGSEPACPSAEGNYATTGAASPDRVFNVTAHKRGILTVATSDANFDSYVYATSAACKADLNSILACSNKARGTAGEKLTLPVDEGKTYTVVVDGAASPAYLSSQGAFRVTFSVE